MHAGSRNQLLEKEMVKVARVQDATRSCAMHRYDNNFIARLINILFDVDERKKERDESLSNASNKLNTRTYAVVCLDNEWIRGEVKKRMYNTKHG